MPPADRNGSKTHQKKTKNTNVRGKMLSPKTRTFVALLVAPMSFIAWAALTACWVIVAAGGEPSKEASSKALHNVQTYLQGMPAQAGWVMPCVLTAMLFAFASVYALGLRPTTAEQRDQRDFAVNVGRATSMLATAYAVSCALAVKDPAGDLMPVILIVLFALLMAGLALVLDGMYIGSPSAREKLARAAYRAAKKDLKRVRSLSPARWWHPVAAWLAPSVSALVITSVVFAASGYISWWRGLAVAAVAYLAVNTSIILSGLADAIYGKTGARVVNTSIAVIAVVFIAAPILLVALVQSSTSSRILLLLVSSISATLALAGTLRAETSSRSKWISPRWAGACLAIQFLKLRVEVRRIDLTEVRRRKAEIETWGSETAPDIDTSARPVLAVNLILTTPAADPPVVGASFGASRGGTSAPLG